MRHNTNHIREFVKKIVFQYTNWGKPYYPYNIEPIQFSKIIDSIDSVLSDKNNKNSCLVEIGVARGMTSTFIAEHLKVSKKDNNFYCIDTFSSFTKADLDYEINYRGKTHREMLGFSYNNFEKWRSNFIKYKNVKPIKADINDFNFSKLEKISFCFLDVDLYKPTKNALNNIIPYLTKNAIIMVDDVVDNGAWDGSGQAFKEFVKEKSLDMVMVGTKCGLIKFRR
ncbi:TylF/MycF family methyltransferase [SAR116 cluster bacterium]|nr:TylF/MycF family methyltransferase [SAR116 cluster bacterium]